MEVENKIPEKFTAEVENLSISIVDLEANEVKYPSAETANEQSQWEVKNNGEVIKNRGNLSNTFLETATGFILQTKDITERKHKVTQRALIRNAFRSIGMW